MVKRTVAEHGVSFRVVEFDTPPIILLRKRGKEVTIETV
jgi:hypothetical protein